MLPIGQTLPVQHMQMFVDDNDNGLSQLTAIDSHLNVHFKGDGRTLH